MSVGDKVRAVIGKGVFDKDNAKFSKVIYVIDSIDGNRYKIKDEEGNIVKRKYKAMELRKVGDVDNRVNDSSKKSSEKIDKKVKKLRKELVGAYAQNLALVTGKTIPKKAKKITEPISKLDDFED